jgi:hypothetical protein
MEENSEADALSNMDLKDFDCANEIKINPTLIPWRILSSLLRSSTELYESIVETKVSKPTVGCKVKASKKVKPVSDW